MTTTTLLHTPTHYLVTSTAPQPPILVYQCCRVLLDHLPALHYLTLSFCHYKYPYWLAFAILGQHCLWHSETCLGPPPSSTNHQTLFTNVFVCCLNPSLLSITLSCHFVTSNFKFCALSIYWVNTNFDLQKRAWVPPPSLSNHQALFRDDCVRFLLYVFFSY